ncbi:MAG: pitrilysin family protein [Gammaproteobacteria bacterium]|nr:pitrilysin family protein [Gammaproteobacteria bacterium]
MALIHAEPMPALPPLPRIALALLAVLPLALAAEMPLQLTPLDYRERLLANGLTVLSLEDHRSPTVAVQVWYRVGAKDDPPGRSGFAHLFEHLMFKRTRHLAAEQFDRLTEDVGGENNAGTSDDGTQYLDTVPSGHLERLLWAEAERLQHLEVDADSFRSERAVVQEEFRQTVLTPPYGRLEHLLQQLSWQRHPYRRPTIGSIEDLDAAGLADVRSFHTTYYRPDNAALVVSGDFDPAQLDRWVDRHFGAIPRPATVIPRVTVTEPPRTEDRRSTVRLPQVPLPALAISWLAPPAGSPDAAALRIAEMLLSGGRSSRLHQTLVERQPLAQEVSFRYDALADGGLCSLVAVVAGGGSLARLERAALAALRRLADAPIAAAEIDKARTLLLTEQLKARETVDGRATALGEAWLLTGRAGHANDELPALLAVTAADVQRVVREVLLQGHRTTLEYRRAGSEVPRKDRR